MEDKVALVRGNLQRRASSLWASMDVKLGTPQLSHESILPKS